MKRWELKDSEILWAREQQEEAAPQGKAIWERTTTANGWGQRLHRQGHNPAVAGQGKQGWSGSGDEDHLTVQSTGHVQHDPTWCPQVPSLRPTRVVLGHRQPSPLEGEQVALRAHVIHNI